MSTISVIAPPTTDQGLHDVGKRIVESAAAIGITLDITGFLYSWVSGTRVIVMEDDDKQITSLALMTYGKRWTDEDAVATVLRVEGPEKNELLNFCATLATGLGATHLVYEVDPTERLTDKEEMHFVRRRELT